MVVDLGVGVTGRDEWERGRDETENAESSARCCDAVDPLDVMRLLGSERKVEDDGGGRKEEDLGGKDEEVVVEVDATDRGRGAAATPASAATGSDAEAVSSANLARVPGRSRASLDLPLDSAGFKGGVRGDDEGGGEEGGGGFSPAPASCDCDGEPFGG